MRRLAVRVLLCVALAGALPFTPPVSAFVPEAFWAIRDIEMHLQLGPSGPLINGCPDWGCSAERALREWNLYLNRSQFVVVRDSFAPRSPRNLLNNVFFDDTIYGDPFDSDTLAVTLLRPGGRGVLVETDVIFNEALDFNAYDGPLRRVANSFRTLQDFQRIALHEFGHVLGLGHPDEFGQGAVAIMNSRISNLDTLQNDDILGAYNIYVGNIFDISLPFPPRNETLAFRTELEAVYRNILRRAPGPSFADPEGSVVWTQEFLRYRMSACRSEQAAARVRLLIVGPPIPGPFDQPVSVCGMSSGFVNFPPRNETLSFRLILEEIYRTELGRLPTPTAVDVEGDVIWITEYLRYRLNRCSHTQATERVIQQVLGLGIQPVC